MGTKGHSAHKSHTLDTRHKRIDSKRLEKVIACKPYPEKCSCRPVSAKEGFKEKTKESL